MPSSGDDRNQIRGGTSRIFFPAGAIFPAECHGATPQILKISTRPRGVCHFLSHLKKCRKEPVGAVLRLQSAARRRTVDGPAVTCEERRRLDFITITLAKWCSE
jgi:hypothetical protein